MPTFWYVNLKEVASKLDKLPHQSTNLSDWTNKINLTIEDNRYRVMSGRFEGNYLTIRYFGTTAGNETVCCAFRWKHIKDLNNSLIPFGWLELSQNPELFDEGWHDFTHFILEDMVYFSFTKDEDFFGNLHSKKALACYRLSPSDPKVRVKVSAYSFTLDNGEFVLQPRHLHPGAVFEHPYSDRLFSAKRKVFAFMRQSEATFKIYCFHKSSILPIGGSNVQTPGTYVTGPNETLFGWNRKGFFGKEVSSICGNKQSITVHRYILT